MSAPYWKAIGLSLLATAVLAATEPLFPAVLKSLLDKGFARDGGFENPILIPLGIVGVFLIRGVFNYLSSFCFSWVSNRVITDIREQMYTRMVQLPTGYLQQHASSVPLTKIAYGDMVDAPRAAAMGRAGRERAVAHFSREAMLDRMESIFRAA